jgi:hypothetical protein
MRQHGGYLWLEKHYLIDQNMMHRVLGLPTYGEYLMDTIKEKDSPRGSLLSVWNT